MHGDFIYSEDINDAEYTYEAPQKIEKTLKRFLLLAAVFISAGVLWIFIISPVTVPVRIDLRSFPGFDKHLALYYAGIPEGSTYIAINAADAQMRLSRHYMVESARLVKRFPDRLTIFIEPRRAVAVSLGNFNGRTLPVYIDRHGVVMHIGAPSAADGAAGALQSLPVVSGHLSGSQQPWLGMRVSASIMPLFSRIGAIGDDDPHIWQAISEIGIAWKSNDLYDLILYPVNNTIKLKMGSDITKENIYYALLMSDASRRLGNRPAEIDVRSGIGVFKTQEARFGE